MRTLLLLRHAKSSWAEPGLEDFDRPLGRRGQRAAPAMGAAMRARGLVPDLVLCSGAARARETLALVLPELGREVPVRFEDGLYLAAAATLRARIRKLPPTKKRVLLVGHNPGMHELALDLAGQGRADDMAALARKFPTAALAALDIDVSRWSAVAPGDARLRAFLTPRSLEVEAGEAN
jgi:phosphohistidine phosphatase